MPITADEIAAGVIAYLDVATLVKDPRIRYVEHGAPFRNGPFLCVQCKGEDSLWLQVTGTRDDRGLRLELLREWRTGGGAGRWLRDSQFIHDARKPIYGPPVAFANASNNVDHYQMQDRPRVLQEGLNASIKELERYGGKAL